jgi:large subunit ribosomal protein L35
MTDFDNFGLCRIKESVRAMPKQKTHKATKKRFRLSATGKAMHRSAGTSHLAAGMSKKRRRNLRGTKATVTLESKRVARSLCGNSY